MEVKKESKKKGSCQESGLWQLPALTSESLTVRSPFLGECESSKLWASVPSVGLWRANRQDSRHFH